MPIVSNKSLFTFGFLMEGNSMLRTTICFERHLERCSAAASCALIVFCKLCKEFTYLKQVKHRIQLYFAACSKKPLKFYLSKAKRNLLLLQWYRRITRPKRSRVRIWNYGGD